MKTITVPKDVLIEKITANRTKHRQDYDEAMAGWHATVLRAIDEARIEFDRQEKTDNLNILYRYSKPMCYVEEYDRVLSMLEWETADKVQLTEDDFRHFVEDDWDWTRGFKMSTSQYSVAAD